MQQAVRRFEGSVRQNNPEVFNMKYDFTKLELVLNMTTSSTSSRREKNKLHVSCT